MQALVIVSLRHCTNCFDQYYIYVYTVLVIPLVFASILVIVYLVQPDDHEGRKLIYVAFWIAFVADTLLGLWILIYIAFLYPDPEVWSIRFGSTPGPGEDPYYEKMSKLVYILWYSLFPWINAVQYLFAIIQTKIWLDLNKDYE